MYLFLGSFQKVGTQSERKMKFNVKLKTSICWAEKNHPLQELFADIINVSVFGKENENGKRIVLFYAESVNERLQHISALE